MPEIRLLVQKGQTPKPEIRLTKFPVLVGRHSECMIRITSPIVSRRHCMLEEHNGQVYVQDLASGNGVFINGVRVKDSAPLAYGDKLEIGPIVLEVRTLLDFNPPLLSTGQIPVAPGAPVDDSNTVVEQ
jgi:pSer/pThr/pTyr-binding forkhead associated (FHA) protein